MTYPVIDLSMGSRELGKIVQGSSLPHPSTYVPYLMYIFGRDETDDFVVYTKRKDLPNTPEDWKKFLVQSAIYGFKKTKKIFVLISIDIQSRTEVCLTFATTDSYLLKNKHMLAATRCVLKTIGVTN